jgi:hypothetical protein
MKQIPCRQGRGGAAELDGDLDRIAMSTLCVPRFEEWRPSDG